MKRGVACLICAVLLWSCGVLKADEPRPIDLEQAEVQYRQFGTWISTARMTIASDGTVKATRLGQGSVMVEGTGVLTGAERKHLAEVLAWLPHYRRSYLPSEEVKDGVVTEILLRYRESVDTVTVSGSEKLPDRLAETIEVLTGLYQRVVGT